MHYTIDATNKPLGRLASEVAVILQGKKNARYEARLLGDDRVTIVNIQEIALTGKKKLQKIYYRHAGALGHLKERKFTDVWAKDPTWVLRHAVRAMLPKNRLRNERMKHLTIKK